MLRSLLIAVTAMSTVTYPFVVAFGLERFEPRFLMLPLVALAAIRALLVRRMAGWVACLGLAAFALIGWILDDPLLVKTYPVMINAVLLAVFAASLARPPSVIERLARLGTPDLPPEGVVYTRRVTQVWCVFFMVNGMAALGTAVWASERVWALYNGFISYLLMGMLFGVEWLIRGRAQAGATRGAARG